MRKQAKALIQDLETLIGNPAIDQEILKMFIERAKRNPKVSRDEGESDHYGTFIMPVYAPASQVFLIHHIKSGFWIPPGGHLDKGESIHNTALREMKEELGFMLTDEPVKLVNISIAYITKSQNYIKRNCKIHYDLWHLALLRENHHFDVDKKEAYDGRWVSFDEALDLCTHKGILAVMGKIFNQIA